MRTFNEVFRKFSSRLTSFKRTIPKEIALHSTNFFKQNFTRQGFYDTTIIAWKKRRRHTDAGQGILTQTGRLRDSIRPTQATFRKIEIVSDTPYGAYHNEGTNRLPKRQFMGESERLKADIKKMIIDDLKKVFR